MAMETRCYHGGEGRTKMKPMAYTGADYLTYVIAMVFIIVMVLIKLF
jgi:energy-coupling factor transport system permease protein